MKKSLILVPMCFAVLLTSCGTSSYYASSGFEDGIYYRPSGESRTEALADNKEVQQLIEQTRKEAAGFSDTLVISGTGNTVDIPFAPGSRYTIYQTDSINQLNINFNFDDWYPGYGFMDYYSYWDWRYWNVFGPSWYRWGTYDPWYWGWYDPWYGGWSWSFRYAWDCHFGLFGWTFPGYWGPGYWGPGYWGWYDPWYGWGYPVASVYPDYVYFGKRNSGVRAGGLTGGRATASNPGRGTAVRRTTQQARPSMSVVRGRDNVLTADRTSASSGVTARRSATAIAGGSDLRANYGEKYVNRGTAGRTYSRLQPINENRTAAGTSTAGFRRAQGTATSSFRRAQGTATEFRNPFENRSQFDRSAASGYMREGFMDRSSYNRSTAIDNNRSTLNRNTFNSATSRSSFSTGRSISRSAGATRSSGSGARSVRR